MTKQKEKQKRSVGLKIYFTVFYLKLSFIHGSIMIYRVLDYIMESMTILLFHINILKQKLTSENNFKHSLNAENLSLCLYRAFIPLF